MRLTAANSAPYYYSLHSNAGNFWRRRGCQRGAKTTPGATKRRRRTSSLHVEGLEGAFSVEMTATPVAASCDVGALERSPPCWRDVQRSSTLVWWLERSPRDRLPPNGTEEPLKRDWGPRISCARGSCWRSRCSVKGGRIGCLQSPSSRRKSHVLLEQACVFTPLVLYLLDSADDRQRIRPGLRRDPHQRFSGGATSVQPT
jgi:hypothetical protein